MLLEGIFAAITTPFYPGERVYYRKLEANMARYSRSLLAGVVVLGSTGEAVMLNDEETREVLRVAAEAAVPEKVLLAGVSRDSVRATLELAEAAAKFHYDAVVVRTPVYFTGQMIPAAVLSYYRSVADRSPLPVVLYNIPKFVPYQIPVELIAELAQHPNIIGIKDSSGDLERIAATVQATRNAPQRATTVTPVFEAVTSRMLSQKAEQRGQFVPLENLSNGTAVAVAPTAVQAPPVAPIKTRSKQVGFQVLTGASSVMLGALKAGASGAILADAAYAPQACQEVYVAWKDNDLKLAEENQKRLLAANRRIVGELGINAIKYACDWNGYFGGYGRSPMIPIGAQEKTEIEALLAQIRN